jgi:hypothetical protein
MLAADHVSRKAFCRAVGDTDFPVNTLNSQPQHTNNAFPSSAPSVWQPHSRRLEPINDPSAAHSSQKLLYISEGAHQGKTLLYYMLFVI